ncbi:hypothetical protein NEMIN01_2474 [Nematocida minor]|uniref:uncharacterized protein n=1 Tax=Nematocida minor TaxID=1912983 RepID=UPI00221FCB9A|nr:uncharacterized protein NEMIN01_2474 [Nematocida minor]KAI5193318.1 hypothetical protein NEMIN01_2474 [Nematocida minor]
MQKMKEMINRQQREKSGKCHNCGRLGHYQSNCRAKKEEVVRTPLILIKENITCLIMIKIILGGARKGKSTQTQKRAKRRQRRKKSKGVKRSKKSRKRRERSKKIRERKEERKGNRGKEIEERKEEEESREEEMKRKKAKRTQTADKLSVNSWEGPKKTEKQGRE